MSQEYPVPTVGAVIMRADGKVLLLKSQKWHGKYVVPGGHIELGETLEHALRREIREETGLEINDIEFIKPTEFIFDPAYHKRRHFIFLDFFCKTGGSDVKLNDEAQEYAWASPEGALKLPLEPYTEPLIHWVILHKSHGHVNGASIKSRTSPRA